MDEKDIRKIIIEEVRRTIAVSDENMKKYIDKKIAEVKTKGGK